MQSAQGVGENAITTERRNRKSRREKPPRAVLLFRRFAGGVWDSLCVSLCASAATFPVLVLRGMSTTVWAVASGVAVLWLVGPMLSFGLGAALLGLAAQNFESLPLFEIIRRPAAFCAEGLAWLMNEWAFRVSVLPGASLWFDGTYAALVCLVLILLCAMAMRRHIRLRAALPTVILLAALAFGLETALSWNVVNIELVGTRASPAVIITQREKAVVLFRGGSTTRRAVESQLEKRGVKTVELLVDLRMQPEEPCHIEAQKRIEAAALAENTTRRASCAGGLGTFPHPTGLHSADACRRAEVHHPQRHGPACEAHPGRVAAGLVGKAGQYPVHRLPDPEQQIPLDGGRRRARLAAAPPSRGVSTFQSGQSMIE